MSDCFATLRLPDGTTTRLVPGDLIGRSWRAALRIDDPRISEAHAMLSLRGDALVLLALRGALRSERGRPASVIPLHVGRKVELIEGIVLEAVQVELPDEHLAVVLDGAAPHVLTGTTWSLVAGAPRSLSHRYDPDAIAHIWSLGEGWMIRAMGGRAAPLRAGGRLEVAGAVLEAHPITATMAGLAATQDVSLAGRPLRLVLRYDVVELHREGEAPLLMNGLRAKLISELHLLGGCAPTRVLSAELWPRVPDPDERQIRLNKVLHTGPSSSPSVPDSD